jgi:hypothetical protein
MVLPLTPVALAIGPSTHTAPTAPPHAAASSVKSEQLDANTQLKGSRVQ